ncbi:MAG: prephenate dehydratase [Chloroflexi bacterium]|nr:prephenate dehydratase [Chloroflexota bacterium]
MVYQSPEDLRRISYLGPAGTFTQLAASIYRPGADLVPYASITASAEAVLLQHVDAAVVPFENSIEGSVGETHDIIVHRFNLAISGELVIPIEQCLMLPPAIELQNTQIALVLSHPQALGQCRSYIARRFPNAKTQATLSTSEAVERMMKAQSDPELKNRVVAIAPRQAAAMHGARIDETHIEDDRLNATRFVVLTPHGHAPTGQDKTTFIFKTKNNPGALVQALKCFADESVNLSRIESRAAREGLGSYRFIVDCDGHRDDEKLKAVVIQLENQVEEWRVVGSYPKAPSL